MDILIEELTNGFPDTRQAFRVLIRLITAALLGAVIGAQREKSGKSAGVRTHMLVTLGTTLFTLAPIASDMGADELSRIIQGLAAGIGFIGAGAILKLHESREIEGLTTAAGIWMTAAVGVATGLGRLGLAIVSTLLAWIILSAIGNIENRWGAKDAGKKDA